MGRITSQRTAAGLVLEVFGDDGQLDARVVLPRPCDHSLLIARLMDWQQQCHEQDAGPRLSMPVLEFRRKP